MENYTGQAGYSSSEQKQARYSDYGVEGLEI